MTHNRPGWRLRRALQRFRRLSLKGTRYGRGNKPAVQPHHPHAPNSHPLPHSPVPPKTLDPFHAHVAYHANIGLKYAGKMVYSEGRDRSMLFGRPKDQFLGAHADCSQYVASIMHWLGVKCVNQWDYTGTLLQKGKPALKPATGLVAVWGPGTGAHTAIVTEKTGNGDWYVVGFGHQGAPDRNTLTGMNAYFHSVRQPGVRYLDFEGR